MDKKYQIHLNNNESNNIYLSIENINERKKYEIIFREASLFWNEHMKHFQNDFYHFYRVLELIFVKKSSDIKWNIVEELDEKLSINLNYNPGIFIFGFNITIEIPREEDKYEWLIKRIIKLEEENKYILSLIQPFEENIKNFKFDN